MLICWSFQINAHCNYTQALPPTIRLSLPMKDNYMSSRCGGQATAFLAKSFRIKQSMSRTRVGASYNPVLGRSGHTPVDLHLKEFRRLCEGAHLSSQHRGSWGRTISVNWRPAWVTQQDPVMPTITITRLSRGGKNKVMTSAFSMSPNPPPEES